jgi:hypothetical protein
MLRCGCCASGIDRSRVEDMEARLKADVLREAARYEQHILVTEEDDDMNVSWGRGSREGVVFVSCKFGSGVH